MKDPHKSKVLTNLKKTRGLLDTIESMVQEGRYCMDIAQQMNAALGYLRSANTTILRWHLSSCAGHKLSSQNAIEKEVFIEELLQIFNVSNR